jgi:integrase
VPHVWQRIRKTAGLPDVRLHDLRHSFASVGALGGSGLPILGRLLGHADTRTTERYVHFAAHPIKAAADRIANTIVAAMSGANAEIVPLAEPKRDGQVA